MKNPLTGTFIKSIFTFDVKGISNGRKEALESGNNWLACWSLSKSDVTSPKLS